MKSKKGLFFVVSLFFSQVMFCGFSFETLVRVHDGYVPIGQLEVGDIVASSDLEGNCFEKKITKKQQSRQENCLCLIVGQEEIITSQSQKFFLANEATWKFVKYLEVGDVLLDSNGDCIKIDEIVELGQVDLLEISVEEPHNFFVSEGEFFVHNVAVTMVVEGAKVLTQIACCGIAAVAGLASSDNSDDYMFQESKKELEGSSKGSAEVSEGSGEEGAGKEEAPRDTGAQAPGKPKEEDKFIPKKGWDEKKVKVQKGKMKGKAGYPDKDGNIWVPTGPKGHGGAHWDVQKSKGGYDNVLPGGKIRPGKKK